MQQPPDRHPPHERRPDDGSTRTKRSSDRLNDLRSQRDHPDDERLTEADLDQHERERESTHGRMVRSDR